jgi:hypothetical protein
LDPLHLVWSNVKMALHLTDRIAVKPGCKERAARISRPLRLPSGRGGGRYGLT